MLTRAKLGLAPDDFAVLAIGDLNENKNHRVLVEAMAGLPANVRLFIAGDGPLRDELNYLAERLGVADRVSLLGFREDIAALLNACDLFCLPSKREGLPVSLIEAMATGTPCLTSDARGCADVLGELGADCLVDKSSVDNWVSRIALIAKDESHLEASVFRYRANTFRSDAAVAAASEFYKAVV